MDGFVQKFYLQDEERGQVGGFFVFDSEASRDAYFASDLRATIGEAYAVKGEPEVSTFHLLFPLREAEGLPMLALAFGIGNTVAVDMESGQHTGRRGLVRVTAGGPENGAGQFQGVGSVTGFLDTGKSGRISVRCTNPYSARLR